MPDDGKKEALEDVFAEARETFRGQATPEAVGEESHPVTYLRTDIVSAARPADPPHVAELLHFDLGGRYAWNWTCSCGGTGQPGTEDSARRQAQYHVDHPDADDHPQRRPGLLDMLLRRSRRG